MGHAAAGELAESAPATSRSSIASAITTPRSVQTTASSDAAALDGLARTSVCARALLTPRFSQTTVAKFGMHTATPQRFVT